MSKKNGTYVDGFVVPVPTAKKDAYRKLAKEAATVFKDHGALTLVECWGDDLPEGKVNCFNSAVLRAPEENVVFAWITWPSKAVRDEGMQKVMEDPRLKAQGEEVPFDGKRMIFGGFEIIVDA